MKERPSIRRDFIDAAQAALTERQQRIAMDHDLACRRLRAATTDEERAEARAEVLRLEALLTG